MTGETHAAPPLVFSHFGYWCGDYRKSVDFWTGVFGFGVSDAGVPSRGGGHMSFMTRRPFEHHQLVAADGRDPAQPTTVAEVGFLAPDLAELRRIAGILARTPGVGGLTAVDSGIAWTLHFTDPAGIPATVSVETEWFVPQPQAWPLDLAADDAAIRTTTLGRCRRVDGFRPRSAWRAETEAALARDGRLQSQATPEIAADAAGGPVFRNDFGAAPAEPFPRVAMSRVGMRAIDLDHLAAFYETELGYLVTGRGRRPAVGALPAAEIVYLTRDPDQFAQLVLTAGRAPDVPSSINQVTFRLPSLQALRALHARMHAHPEVGGYRPVDHGNSFSLYCTDPEGNTLEFSHESVWYTPAPSAWPLDFARSDEEMLRTAEERCRSVPGFMMREAWKARARAELTAAGRLEAEDLVGHLG